MLALDEDTMPEPSAELVLLRVLLEAHLESLPRKQAVRFVQSATRLMDLRDSLGAVRPIRVKPLDTATFKARREASAWFRRVLSAYAGTLQ